MCGSLYFMLCAHQINRHIGLETYHEVKYIIHRRSQFPDY